MMKNWCGCRAILNSFIRLQLQNNSIGRKLDFLIQEMNRETNTIGSKANDLEIRPFGSGNEK